MPLSLRYVGWYIFYGIKCILLLRHYDIIHIPYVYGPTINTIQFFSSANLFCVCMLCIVDIEITLPLNHMAKNYLLWLWDGFGNEPNFGFGQRTN